MSFEIVNSPERIAERIRSAIAEAIPGAEVEVAPGSPGHFAVRVTSREFDGQPRVKQQQRVYAAIRHLMSGEDPPVHAIDELQTRIG